MSWGTKGKGLSPEMRRALFEHGWQVLSLYQPPWLFPRDGRKLSLCPIPSDPWNITIHNGASILSATRQLSGQGATADEAAANALSGARSDLRGAFERLAGEIGSLVDAYRSRQPSAKPCDLGVGCDETGFCYASAMGQPERCGRES